MNNHARGRGPRLLTIDRIRVEHEQLLEVPSDGQNTLEIARFVDRLVNSGAYFDEAPERKSIQGYLDYWTSELAKYPTAEVTVGTQSGLKRRAIYEFDAQALKDLQDAVKNPFELVASAVDSLSGEDRQSPAAILGLIDQRAQSQNLRFQEGLVREIASQVAGDREGATLLEFCLWHLFEDPETRFGNKIYRPTKSNGKNERVDFFSCKVYLVHKAQGLCKALPEPERAIVVKTLIRINSRRANRRPSTSLLRSAIGRFTNTSASLQEWVRSATSRAQEFVLYDVKGLNLTEFLERSRLAVKRTAGGWMLVHRALAERWDELRDEINKREWRAQFVWKIVVFVSLIAVGALSMVIFNDYAAKRAVASLADAERSSGRSPRERISSSVEGLKWSRRSLSADTSYARKVANDAIGAAIVDLAQGGNLGNLPPYPTLPRIECARTRGESPSYTVTVSLPDAEPSMLSSDACPVFTVTRDGKRLGAAWERGKTTIVKVFDIPQGFDIPEVREKEALKRIDLSDKAPWLGKLQPLRLSGGGTEQRWAEGECNDRTLRFSDDGKVVVYDCLPVNPKEHVRVHYIEIGESGSRPESSTGVFEGWKDQEELISAMFRGAASRFVAVGVDGYVGLWQGKTKDRSFRSDFVRVVTGGRPTSVAFYLAEPESAGWSGRVGFLAGWLGFAQAPTHYAVYLGQGAPVVRIYEQSDSTHATLAMEHYPPGRVGTPVAMQFTTKGPCLRIQARAKPKGDSQAAGRMLVNYYLIFESKALRDVGEALLKDLDRHSEELTTKPYANVPRYWDAIKNKCGEKDENG